MTRMCRSFPSAAVFGLLILHAWPGGAQTPLARPAAGHPSSKTYAQSAIGDLAGVVIDERGSPIPGAMVSAVGRTVVVGTTDRDGRFTLRALPRGPYVLRAHLSGYRPSRTRTIQLASASLVAPPVELQRLGAAETGDGATQLAGLGGGASVVSTDASAPEPGDSNAADDQSETAWYLRHLPRSVLKDATQAAWDSEAEPADRGSLFERTMGTPARLASLFADFPMSGELNLLTTGSFGSPEDLFSANRLARSVTYVSVGTEAAGGDWAVQGAMTQGDLASWIIAGSYTSEPSARHAYDVGMSYSMQRYDAGNAVALAAVSDGARNVGSLALFDRWTLSPRVVVVYGSRYARYDYLNGPGLWSPRVSISVAPIDRLRVNAAASQRTLAPGAEEFSPPSTGLWLPPERTFAPLSPDGQFRAEQTRHYEVSVERDVTDGLVMAVRAFRQRVDDQLVTMFGVRVPGEPEADIGNYHVGTAGDVDARGWGVGVTHEITGYVRSSVDYSVTTATWAPSSGAAVIALWAPSAVRQGTEEVRGLRTSVQAEIPQTATRVYALYHVNTLSARHEVEAARPGTDVCFDVRVNQALPFLNFSSAQWEALVDVRNLFREAGPDTSVYDEIIVVRPPKRIVGGLTVRF
jgi:hypothetical protein